MGQAIIEDPLKHPAWPHPIVGRAEWRLAAAELLAAERAWVEERDRLSLLRRAMPWVLVEEDYVFEGDFGAVTLSDMFGARSQLIIYHFRFEPEWTAGCRDCSWLCDQLDRALPHLEQKDVHWVAESRAPIEKILAYQQRMGWSFPWVSSGASSFNPDFNSWFVLETEEDDDQPVAAEQQFGPLETPGASIFFRAPTGAIYHVYSSFGLGDDMFDSVSTWLDLLPNGRQTETGEFWIRWRNAANGASFDEGRVSSGSVADEA